jgi:hypothetical protein
MLSNNRPRRFPPHSLRHRLSRPSVRPISSPSFLLRFTAKDLLLLVAMPGLNRRCKLHPIPSRPTSNNPPLRRAQTWNSRHNCTMGHRLRSHRRLYLLHKTLSPCLPTLHSRHLCQLRPCRRTRHSNAKKIRRNGLHLPTLLSLVMKILFLLMRKPYLTLQLKFLIIAYQVSCNISPSSIFRDHDDLTNFSFYLHRSKFSNNPQSCTQFYNDRPNAPATSSTH